MFFYPIGFFTKNKAYKTELIKNDTKFRHQEYQDILIEAHKNTHNVDDLEQKRMNVLDYLESKYEFEYR
ncbi:hypothetical protein [Paenibacillus odorifer]|uniref:hypothetical protein n=1 Tax=Paenibacillus odorifer TaxID=189426 RepID=UPI00096D9A37|nr:hypothetical protein [Paenibacillus odorifer]OMD75298.1 hypothetical protein BSK50_19045 [Paenibacillus odorifer]